MRTRRRLPLRRRLRVLASAGWRLRAWPRTSPLTTAARPIVDVAGRQLAYRSRRSVGTYFRLLSTCDRCHEVSVRRSVRIKSRRDLDQAVALAERFGADQHCAEVYALSR